MADSEDPIAPTDQEGAEKAETTPATKKTPSDFLRLVLGRPIRVKLNSGVEYRGVLACLDGFLNIAMEQTEEYNVDGQLRAKYGDCFIRGNNVLYISAQSKKR
eukprot:CAMPEP_0168723470 /NCGR_PEP_ID=MMETSP0724-20121128/3133_1 /TAXON_ID=265536 /ORGANISM="Amphiprora sp., Strain CCMP467" /LENGTH=102 /DNA_ID=CAMNT_0008770181 /DNA_START=15 /DNA_END=323 /DNA_ORIENTATION=-